MDELCGLFGYTRQAYYKRDDEAQFRKHAIESIITERVREYRSANPRIGAVKLYILIRKQFDSDDGYFPGRDAFINILRSNSLLLRIKRRRHYRTTDSTHPYFKYPNLIAGLSITRPNMVWVSDITYVETLSGVCYLSLLTDAYSRKILGWALGPTLEKEYPLRALKQALSTVTWSPQTDIIHHSDRGCQYCSYEYVECLKNHNIRVSMTQSGDPLENAIAERANGILKTEWLYHMAFRDMEHCSEELPGIINFYNNERPHMSLGYNTPDQVHRGQAEECKIWKNPWQQKYEGSPMM